MAGRWPISAKVTYSFNTKYFSLLQNISKIYNGGSAKRKNLRYKISISFSVILNKAKNPVNSWILRYA